MWVLYNPVSGSYPEYVFALLVFINYIVRIKRGSGFLLDNLNAAHGLHEITYGCGRV